MPNKSETFSLPILSWFDEPIKQSIISLFNDLNTATEALDLFRKYKRKHFNFINTTLGNIKILGMNQPISLVKIYTPALVSTTIHSRLYEKDWHSAKGTITVSTSQKKKEESDTIGADEFVESHQRVVILGSAGSGKTTFLRYLALAYSNRKIFRNSNLKSSKFPLFISMLAYSQQKDPDESLLLYMIKELEARTDKYAEYFVKRILEKGHAIVLLDALDEVPLSQRDNVIKEIKELSSMYPNSKLVLSCRTADYKIMFEEFFEVELKKLSKEAVRKVIKAWFGQEEKKAAQLITHLKQDKSVQSLTETPLLLGLLCTQFRHDLILPKRKTELYKRCIDAFLRDWDSSRGFRRDSTYANLSDERKERIFEHIAGVYFVNRNQYYFPEPELEEEIGLCCERFGIPKAECKGVLSEIERHHGILERFSADSFMFSHPSFEEYFAARYLISKRMESETVKTNYEDKGWTNTIEFIVSMLENPSSILLFLKEQSLMRNLKNYPAMARRTERLWLLYRCMNTGAALDPPVRKQLYEHLVDSQIEISKIYERGGVFPIAALMESGVKHSYLFFHKRQTLYQALQPFRLLANEILLSPSEDYAKVVLNRLEQLELPEDKKKIFPRYSYLTLMLCLSVPLASIFPKEVSRWLDRVIEENGPKFLVQIAQESKQVLLSTYI